MAKMLSIWSLTFITPVRHPAFWCRICSLLFALLVLVIHCHPLSLGQFFVLPWLYVLEQGALFYVMPHVTFGWCNVAVVIWAQDVDMLSIFQRQSFDRHFTCQFQNCWNYRLSYELLWRFIFVSITADCLCVLPFFLFFKWVVVHRVWLAVQVQSVEVVVADFKLAWFLDWSA